MKCLQCGHDVFTEFGDGGDINYFECDSCCMGYAPLVFKEIDRLQAIVDELETTADNVPVVRGMKVYQYDPCGYLQSYDVGRNSAMDDSSMPSPAYLVFNLCYSTREEAELAMEENQ